MFKVVKRIINWTGPLKKRILLGCVYSFVVGIFIALPVVFSSVALAFAIEDAQGGRAIRPNQIWLISGLMIFSVIGRFYFSYLKAKIQDTCGLRKTSEERIQFGGILKRVPLGFFKQHSTGELLGAVTTDLSFMDMHVMGMVDSVLNGYITIVVMVISLSIANIWLGVISIAGLMISHFFLNCLQKASQTSAPIHQRAQDEMIAASLEYIRGIAVVKAFNQQGASIQSVKGAFNASKKINIKIEKSFAHKNLWHIITLKLTSILIVFLSSILGLTGELSVAAMLMIDIFSFVIFLSAENLNNAAHVLQRLNATLDKMEMIKTASFIDKDGHEITVKKYNIKFENVDFSYDSRKVLKNISFEIPEKQTTVIVGSSGSGKTTICNLIARFYDISKGAIYLDGINLKEFTCRSLLENISMVFQDVYLFNDTIYNNIHFGNPKASREEVIEAAKAARCHEFISELPKGYETMVEECGSSLSGGEKQRLSIARSLLKDSPIIILDEATANVDPENEQYIQEAITNLVKGKTVIIIAHRLATIENANQILVMSGGQLVQRGTHDELIQMEGLYRNFISIRKQAEGWSISKG